MNDATPRTGGKGSRKRASEGPGRRIVAVAAGIAIIASGAAWWWSAGQGGGSGSAGIEVRLPDRLSSLALEGKAAWETTCARCHGQYAQGTDRGPPLVHDIYNPGHHADQAFYLAAKRGARAHHWRFGDMPPQPQVTRREVTAIIEYVRALQRENGIVYKPHRM